MKIITAVIACGLLSIISSSSFAASSINREQASHREPLGIVSFTEVNASPVDLYAKLDQKADAMGASAYHIIELREGDNWHVTARLYK